MSCTQPGCGGTVQDGYCDTCGLAAATPSTPSAPAGPAGSEAWPGGSPGTASGAFSGSPSSRSRSRRTSGRSARGRLGAGLVEIPPVPSRDPASAVLANPRVPENKRFCSGCDQPVGRDRDGRPGMTEGFCRNCGARFSFSPKLEAGELVAGDPSDWRLAWYHGLRNLALAADARGAFSAVYSELPGEAAPKLALAFAAEAAGDPATAGHYFGLVWSVDRSCVSAAFGLARACLATGDRPGAIAALAAVPGTSSHHAAAQIAAVRILVARGPGQGVQISGDDLRQADGRLGQLGVDDLRREQLTVEVLRAALDWCGTGQPTGKSPIAGCEPNPRALRFGLERSYRALARLTPDEDRRIELVDMANAIRPRTLT